VVRLPGKKRNNHFLDELRKVEPDRPVAFLCPSGVRSHYAAAANGSRGVQRSRKLRGRQERARLARRRSGWRGGLPWRQDDEAKS
jgi:rhodanese-related sulfurtransferase